MHLAIQHKNEVMAIIGVIIFLIICANLLAKNIKLACKKCGVELTRAQELAHPDYCCNCSHGPGGILDTDAS